MDLVKVTIAKHQYYVMIELGYNHKKEHFYYLTYEKNMFKIITNNLARDVFHIFDYSDYSEEELFQESLVWEYNRIVDIEKLFKYQQLMKDIMNNYPCELQRELEFIVQYKEV
ncbi:hypothetical protein FOI42_RS03365 [Escherichia coli]|nr:hypothetical protein [Escherichia coli]HCQ0858643.1 hypothetical protein [Escherichia coli]